jgi:hypothetical protein
MVFSNKDIIPGSENEADFITDYRIGDDLYYRVYQDTTIGQYIELWGLDRYPVKQFKHILFKFYIDDQYVNEYFKVLTTLNDDEFFAISSFGSVMRSEQSCTGLFCMTDEFRDFCMLYKDRLKGSHKIRIESYMFNKTSYYVHYGTGVVNTTTDDASFGDMAGIKSTFHRQHLGKVVFSDKPISEDPDPADIITEYSVGQPLYFRVFMDNTIEIYRKMYDYGSSFKQVLCYFYVDGEKFTGDRDKNFANLDMTDEQIKTSKSLTGQIMSGEQMNSSPDKIDLQFAFIDFLTSNNKALSGTHTVKMELILYAHGLNKITVTLGTGELTTVLTTVDKNNPNLCYTPKAAVSDPSLEAKMIAEYNAEFSGKSTAKKAWINYRDWEIVKNTYTGEIICKARTAILYTIGADGSCSYEEISFEMQYLGGGKYGSLKYAGPVPGGFYKVLCECGK